MGNETKTTGLSPDELLAHDLDNKSPVEKSAERFEFRKEVLSPDQIRIAEINANNFGSAIAVIAERAGISLNPERNTELMQNIGKFNTSLLRVADYGRQGSAEGDTFHESKVEMLNVFFTKMSELLKQDFIS